MELFQENKSVKENLFFGLTILAFVYFIIRLIFFATHISHYVPPDEVSHFGLCQSFSKTLFIPENSEETFAFGLTTHIPYLYYYIMGKCLNLNFFPVSNLIFLRLINCILCFATVIYGYKWMRLITPNRICHVMFVFLITNTPMFSLIGASVSYDNLANLFSVMTLFYLHIFFKNKTPDSFLLFSISLLGGALTKMTFLPLVLAYLGILTFHKRNHLKSIFSSIKKTLPVLELKEKILSGTVLILLVLNLSLYLENVIRYRKIVPDPIHVLTEEQYMKNRIVAQTQILSLYKSGKITIDEAVKKVKETIHHPGDRAASFYLLNLIRSHLSNPAPPMDRIHYTWFWMRSMLNGAVSLEGHIPMIKRSYIAGIYQVIILFSFFFAIRYWKTDTDSYLSDALFICIFYATVLMQFVNYPIYIQTKSLINALLGRYFFPVLVPFYAIVAYYLITPFRKKSLQIIIFSLISVYFIWGDFPYFLQNATSQWFR